MDKKLSRNNWIKKVAKILRAEPYLWDKQSADNYTDTLAESFYDEEYTTPEEAVVVDSSYWD